MSIRYGKAKEKYLEEWHNSLTYYVVNVACSVVVSVLTEQISVEV
jgi:hypothetical protein